MPTRCLNDILRQPGELRRLLARTLEGRELGRAAEILGGATDLYVTGIGASWHAGMAVEALFSAGGRPVHLVDASELLRQTSFRPGSAILVLSRSGKSVEVVGLLDAAERAGVRVVAVTNGLDSPLGTRAHAVVPLGIAPDHAASIVAYSAVALAGGLIAARETAMALDGVLGGLDLPAWAEKVERWDGFGSAYFLARGGSLATAHEARLLWEEAAKCPATALTTGGFRHGPQEVVRPGLFVGLWVDAEWRRAEDLALARDLRRLGARVMIVGQGLPEEEGDLVFNLPSIPAGWQFLIDVIPVQLAAESFSRKRGEDPDTFRLCSYVVEKEGGLLP